MRHGPDLVQLADQKIGEQLLWVGCRLLHWLMTVLKQFIRRRLMGALMLMDILGRSLCRCGHGRLRRVPEASLLKLEQLRYCTKLGPEVLSSRFMFGRDLFHELFELRLVGADLLFQQTGTVLQIPADITHC